MKKILVSMFLLVFGLCLVGCKIEEKAELHFYTRPHTNYQIAGIIYEIQGDPTKIIASGFDDVTYEYVNSNEGMSSHPAFTFTYADGHTESVYCYDVKTEKSNILVKK